MEGHIYAPPKIYSTPHRNAGELSQDIYLTGNPQITFFKVIYRRHTNFSMESIEQTFNGQADWNKKVTCTISRNGDLIHRVYLRMQLPDVTVTPHTSTGTARGFRWLNWIGHILVKSVEVEIGGQRIDKQYGEWLHIWNELTQTAGHSLGYANMVGNTPDLTDVTWIAKNSTGTLNSSNGVLPSTETSITVAGKYLYIPLQFWFCRNPGLALPLIALQYHEVKINLELRDVKDCYWAGESTIAEGEIPTTWTSNLDVIKPGSLQQPSLFVDYCYLDTDERRRFAQVSHEYLIEQIQYTGDESTSQSANKFKMSFNHPVKELVWVVQPDAHLTDGTTGKQWFNFTDGDEFGDSVVAGGGASGGAQYVQTTAFFGKGENPVATCKIQLNGHDRFSERDGRYFNLVQPYQHHENVPSKGINVYSFALQPEGHQPSGTCNMSRIDNATLNVNLTSNSVKTSNGNPRSCRVKIFAVNYNVLRVMSGMGGLNHLLMVICMPNQKTAVHGVSGNLMKKRRCAPDGTVLAHTETIPMPAVSFGISLKNPKRHIQIAGSPLSSIVPASSSKESIKHEKFDKVKIYRDWVIRSQGLSTGKVQRLYGCGPSSGLRYSPIQKETCGRNRGRTRISFLISYFCFYNGHMLSLGLTPGDARPYMPKNI